VLAQPTLLVADPPYERGVVRAQPGQQGGHVTAVWQLDLQGASVVGELPKRSWDPDQHGHDSGHHPGPDAQDVGQVGGYF